MHEHDEIAALTRRLAEERAKPSQKLHHEEQNETNETNETDEINETNDIPALQEQTTPLLLLHTLDSRLGTLISHLPMRQHLTQAWVKITGSPFCQHQSLSLSSLRRGEPFALVGGGFAARRTIHFLLHEFLWEEPDATTLFLVPDDATAAQYVMEMKQLADALDSPLTIAHIRLTDEVRETASMRVLFVTPETLHHRLLRYHGRVWNPFWQQLQLLFLMNVDSYHGVAAAHLSTLLMRMMRLIPSSPFIAATLNEALESDVAFHELTGHYWRIITALDTPQRATTLALWEGGQHQLQEVIYLAEGYHRAGYQVHITCHPLEMKLIERKLSDAGITDITGMTVGLAPQDAHVQLFAGYPEPHTLLRQTLSGALAKTPLITVVVVGEHPVEHMVAQSIRKSEPAQGAETIRTVPPPTLLPPPTNAYVAAQHLLCAASERPLDQTEVAAWNAEEIVSYLEQHKQLIRLPGKQTLWQPAPSIGDPYEHFDIHAAGSDCLTLYNEQQQIIGTLDPAASDRWGFVGAAMPWARSGYRVVERDDEQSTLTLQPEPNARCTFPLRSCTVAIREEEEQQTICGRTAGWGRVLIDEEVFGYHEVVEHHMPYDTYTPHAPYEQQIDPALTTRWTAPAVWIDLPMRVRSTGQLVGWSVVAALPLRVLCSFTDIVPAYDADINRLYLVDAHPGGNGLSHWVYANLEHLLPLAYDLAMDNLTSPLFQTMMRIDKEWLLPFVGQGDRVGTGEPLTNTKHDLSRDIPGPQHPIASPYPSTLPSTHLSAQPSAAGGAERGNMPHPHLGPSPSSPPPRLPSLPTTPSVFPVVQSPTVPSPAHSPEEAARRARFERAGGGDSPYQRMLHVEMGILETEDQLSEGRKRQRMARVPAAKSPSEPSSGTTS
jgi:hypothetical protein